MLNKLSEMIDLQKARLKIPPKRAFLLQNATHLEIIQKSEKSSLLKDFFIGEFSIYKNILVCKKVKNDF